MISASSNTLKVSGRKLIQASSSSQEGYAVQDVFMALISCLINFAAVSTTLIFSVSRSDLPVLLKVTTLGLP